jgi:hypothetical protein
MFTLASGNDGPRSRPVALRTTSAFGLARGPAGEDPNVRSLAKQVEGPGLRIGS